MNFAKVVHNCRRGRIAKIDGMIAELEQAHKALGRLIEHDDRLVMKLENDCLYLYESVPASFSVVLFPLSQIPRQ